MKSFFGLMIIFMNDVDRKKRQLFTSSHLHAIKLAIQLLCLQNPTHNNSHTHTHTHTQAYSHTIHCKMYSHDDET